MTDENKAYKMKMYTIIEHLQNIKNENDAIDLIVADIVSTHGKPKKGIKRVAKLAFKNKINEFKDDMNMLEQMLEEIA